MSAHAKFSPSGASKWMVCPGSMAAEAEITETRNSPWAAEGTLAHEIREQALLGVRKPKKWIGETHTVDGIEFTVDEAMIDHLMPGIKRVQQLGGKQYIEKRVSAERWAKKCWGTLDCGIILDDIIEINDLKFGAGVPVSPKRNKQLMIYALAFWDSIAREQAPHIKKFRLVIDQPRAAGGGGEWEISLKKLLKFGEQMKRAQKATKAKNAPRVPGESQCKFCRAKSQCGALAEMLFETTRMKFSDLDKEEPEARAPTDLDAAQRAKLAANASLLKTFIDTVSARVLEDAVAGLPTPGLKAVKGKRGNAAWRDVEKAETVLSVIFPPEVYETRKLATPTAIKDYLKRKKQNRGVKGLARLITQSEGRPTLVPEDDRRPAIDRRKAFKNLDKEDA